MLPTGIGLPDNILVLTVVGTAVAWTLGCVVGYWVYNDAKGRHDLDEKRWAIIVGAATAGFVIWGVLALVYYLSKRN